MTSTSWPLGYIRSPLARNIYLTAIQNDVASCDCCSDDKWYGFNKSLVTDETASKFTECNRDETTVAFLDQCYVKYNWVFTQVWHMFAKTLLSFFLSVTSTNGLLNRGSMFVMSSGQFESLLDSPDWHADRLLDIGAGDGYSTSQLADHFDNVYCTEASGPMTKRLSDRGYTVFDIDGWNKPEYYDMISCLNVLDRCDKPLSLLQDIRKSLKPATGLFLLAVVLPFNPLVENGRRTTKPSELVKLEGKTAEEQFQNLLDTVLVPLGFQLVSFTKVPYLSEGDLNAPYYFLTDIVMLLKVAEF